MSQSPFGPAARVAGLLSDERLAERASEGDRTAFTAIYRRYHQVLYRYCLAMLGDGQDAQDALQNTMVKVLKALPGEQRRIELKPWLYRVAHNESVELLRRRRDSEELGPEYGAGGMGLAEDAAVRERLRHLLSDLHHLPERQRAVLVMRELAGLEFAEIAETLGTSPGVVRQTLYEARLGLRQMSEGREMTCATVTRALSEGDGRVLRRRDIRSHLRSCDDCRRFGEEIDARAKDLAALAPLPAVAVTGLLHGLLGGSGSAAGPGLGGVLGGGAAKSIGASTALKGAATIAAATVIGVTAADRGNLFEADKPASPGSAAPSDRVSSSSSDPRGRALRIGASATPAIEKGRAAASGRADLEVSRAMGETVDESAGPEGSKTSIEAKQAHDAPAAPSAHPHGRGHEKQHPVAATHGQATAAAHKAASHGSPKSQGQVSHPSHPPPSSNPSPESGPPSPMPNAGEPGPHSKVTAPAAKEPLAGHDAGGKP